MEGAASAEGGSDKTWKQSRPGGRGQRKRVCAACVWGRVGCRRRGLCPRWCGGRCLAQKKGKRRNGGGPAVGVQCRKRVYQPAHRDLVLTG